MTDDAARAAFEPQAAADEVRFCVILPNDLYAHVRVLADQEYRSRGYVTRGLLVLGLRAHRAGAALPSPAEYSGAALG